MSANDNFSLHDDEELSLHDDASLDGSVPASNKGDAPAKPPQIITTNTLSNIKLPVLQKDDYDTWAMEMEHYLEYIDNEVWKVIQNGNSKKRVTKGKDGVYRVLPPATQEEQFADEKERKARTLLLMAVPKDHLRRFHGMDDAKEIWAAIKTRFGGNANSKKMQKAVLKQQFEAFTISSKESLEKGYDRFQKLLSQLDALGASVSDEDANHKFLRSLPPAWDSLAMTMRTKKNIDTLSIDDLYNNLSVFEQDIQKTSSSSLTSDNVAFLSQAKASSSKHKPHHNSGSYSSYTTSSSKATPTAALGFGRDGYKLADCYDCHQDKEVLQEDRECKFKGTKDGSRQEANRGQDFKPVRTEKEALMTIDEGQINWVEQTTDEEINHALMAFTVNNEVSMCSKLCLDSFNALKAKYDELQSEFGDQEASLTAHKLGLKKLESQLRASHKQQLSLNEKLHFQANQIFEKDEKLKKYRRIGMKAVKDKDALQKIVDSWFASSKNLWKLIDCGMSSTVKLGLGYSIKSNAEVLSYEEEMNRGIFASIRETDPGYYDIPLYSRFKQVEYKGVPHPLSGDYTPREQEDIDDSLYEYGKYGPQPQTPSPTVSNASSISFSICPSNDSDGDLGTVSGVSSTHYSTCQSNDSVGEPGTVSDHSVNDDPVSTQKTQPKVPTTTQTVDPSCAQHVKPPRQPIRTPVTSSPIPSYKRQNWNQRMKRKLGAGYSFERKPCFVCGSLSHLIKNCDYYEKKMAREAALERAKANQFTPRPVNVRPNLSTASNTIKTGRVNVNTGHGNVNSGSVHVNAGTQVKSGASRFNTGKQHVNSGSMRVNSVTQFKSGASRINTGNQHINTARVNRPVSNRTSPKPSQVNFNSQNKCFSKQSSPVNRPVSRKTAHESNKYAVKGKMGTAVKTSAGCVWRKITPLSNTNSGPTPDSNVNDHPLKHMEHRGIFDSGCSGHMTGNRAHLEDYQELSKVGSVTFGGSKGSISGKGTIRLGNLVFDDVAFVKELGHFNLFSISQICDKKLNVLFTEKECYVVSSDFKMPDENQVLLKVPRQHNMYTFDMKNVDSSKGYTCLLAKASSNEAKLWHRRLGHLNFKNLNKLVKDNLVRGLPSKSFKNDHTCVACQKGKQHKASCKAKIDRYVTHPLHTLHMDLFGPTSVRSINHASYCLVITDDYSSKAFRVYNLVTKRVEVNLHVNFLEEKPNVQGIGHRFQGIIDIDVQTEEDADLMVVSSTSLSEKIATKKTHSPRQPSSTQYPNTNPVNTGSFNLNTAFEEVNTGNTEAISPSADHEEEVFSDADDDEMPEIRIYDKSSEEALEDGSWVEAMQEELLAVQASTILSNVCKECFLYGTIDEEVYVSQPPGFVDPDHPTKVIRWSKSIIWIGPSPRSLVCLLVNFLESMDTRGHHRQDFYSRRNKKDIMLVQVYVDDIIFGSTNKSWCDEFEALMQSRFQMSSMGELTFFLGLQVKQNKEGIFISQDKYVAEILKKFDLVHVKAAITPMETKLPLTKDEEAFDVDVHLYRSMIEDLPTYLKGKPNLGLWYPRESPLDLEAFSDSDYGGSNLDRKSTTGGCQFLGQRLISWQCKKQTIVATSTTEAEYVAAANCCGQVLWVQNQLLDYGFNFMNTKIHIDNESTICIVKNPVYHSKTKHIEIRHHFIRDCYEKKLIRFAEIVDFLRGSNLRYALTANPTIYDSLVKQFWQSAVASTREDGSLEISATVDTKRYIISEASIRDSLQLDDATGISMLPNDDLFQGMGQIGYPTDGTFTFWKSFFTPQWRYLVHHLLHCISSKSGGWDQFGSNIATALICLSTGRVYNFSKLIFDGMMANLKNKKKFLMYPRFLQLILNIQTENKHPYLAVSLTKKIFGNMKRGFQGVPRPLLPSMLLVATNPIAGQEHAAQAQTQPLPPPPPIPSPTPTPIPTSTSPPPIIPSPTPTPIPTPTSPPPPPPPETEPPTDEHIYEEQSPVHHHFSPSQAQAPSHMPTDDLLQTVPKLISRIDSLELDLKQTKLTMGNAIVKLVKKVKKLEGFLKKRRVEFTKTLSRVSSLKSRSKLQRKGGLQEKKRVTSKGKSSLKLGNFQEDILMLKRLILLTVLLVKTKEQREGRKALCSVKELPKEDKGTDLKKEASLAGSKIRCVDFPYEKKGEQNFGANEELSKSMACEVNFRRKDFAKKMFESHKDSFEKICEELQTQDTKGLKEDKDDEAKVDEPTKKFGFFSFITQEEQFAEVKGGKKGQARNPRLLMAIPKRSSQTFHGQWG
ncbi:putative ribonuclease H-like domain-containing protein [Tanacetum coccineum]